MVRVVMKTWNCASWTLREDGNIRIKLCSRKGRLFYEQMLYTLNDAGYPNEEAKYLIPRGFVDKMMRKKTSKAFAEVRPALLAMGLTEDEARFPWKKEAEK
jgi:flavin-dependent dehydrogenase